MDSWVLVISRILLLTEEQSVNVEHDLQWVWSAFSMEKRTLGKELGVWLLKAWLNQMVFIHVISPIF
jgi:hypothetical protein